jgi:hypothetical protein
MTFRIANYPLALTMYCALLCDPALYNFAVAEPIAPFELRTSGQLSTCSFVLDWQDGRVLDDFEINNTILEAKNQFVRLRADEITIRLTGSVYSAPAFSQLERERIFSLAERVGWRPDEVKIGSYLQINQNQSDKVYLHLNVCNNAMFDQYAARGPNDPREAISFRIPSIHVTVPVGYLIPTFWLDRPVGTSITNIIPLILQWPILTPENNVNCISNKSNCIGSQIRIQIIESEPLGKPYSDFFTREHIPFTRENIAFIGINGYCYWRNVYVDGNLTETSPNDKTVYCVFSVEKPTKYSVRIQIPPNGVEHRHNIVSDTMNMIRSFVRP